MKGSKKVEKVSKNIGIYVHIPFCKKKCSYCDFVSYEEKQNCIQSYIAVLIEEIKKTAKGIKNIVAVNTIYIGGGTPSILDSKLIVKIMNTLKEEFNIKQNAEITIEVNPGTITLEKLEDYKKSGINRISIGLQSTNDNIIKQIGRIHNYEQFLQTYNLARKVGFKNINVDLMLALPNQTIEILKESLLKIIKLAPEHISVYSLILEEGTKLYNLVEENKLQLPDEETERKMYWETKKILEENGYNHYEISNFAKKGYESLHNLNCWNQEEYIGFGVASHSYFNNKRYSNIQNLEKYVNKENIVTIHEEQTKEDRQKEYMLLGLRKIDGIKISEFKHKFIENPLYLFRKELDKLVKQELIEIDVDNIKLTQKGLDLANMTFSEFI